MNVLCTGSCGFIGSHLIDFLLAKPEIDMVVNVDYLSYASQPYDWPGDRYRHYKADITVGHLMDDIFDRHQPDLVFHLAAHTHVDRSIADPLCFVDNNIVGTAQLLETFYQINQGKWNDGKRFIYVSTDEVYGSIPPGQYATEDWAFRPSSPYSASKASADLLVQSWIKTYNFPALIVRPSNCYGPRQHPEKLIPKTIKNILNGLPIPIYGNGQQIRDWLYVDDLVQGLWAVMKQGQIGEAYNLGAGHLRNNLELVNTIRDMIGNPTSPIEMVTDRPGHDQRYAMQWDRAWAHTGWKPSWGLITGLKKTIDFYRQNIPCAKL